jgi:hypothetical protein
MLSQKQFESLKEKFVAQFMLADRKALDFDALLTHAKQWIGKPKCGLSEAQKIELRRIWLDKRDGQSKNDVAP